MPLRPCTRAQGRCICDDVPRCPTGSHNKFHPPTTKKGPHLLPVPSGPQHTPAPPQPPAPQVCSEKFSVPACFPVQPMRPPPPSGPQQTPAPPQSPAPQLLSEEFSVPTCFPVPTMRPPPPSGAHYTLAHCSPQLLQPKFSVSICRPPPASWVQESRPHHPLALSIPQRHSCHQRRIPGLPPLEQLVLKGRQAAGGGTPGRGGGPAGGSEGGEGGGGLEGFLNSSSLKANRRPGEALLWEGARG